MLDTHCHIDLYPDPHAVAKEVERQGILTIAVTNLPSHFEMGQPHLRGFRRIRLALGLHPLMAEHHKKERSKFKQMLSRTSYIGEVGLDFSKVDEIQEALKSKVCNSFSVRYKIDQDLSAYIRVVPKVRY